MGGRVVYGETDEDGTLTFIYAVDGAGLKTITKEEEGYNMFKVVFHP